MHLSATIWHDLAVCRKYLDNQHCTPHLNVWMGVLFLKSLARHPWHLCVEYRMGLICHSGIKCSASLENVSRLCYYCFCCCCSYSYYYLECWEAEVTWSHAHTRRTCKLHKNPRPSCWPLTSSRWDAIAVTADTHPTHPLEIHWALSNHFMRIL